MSEHCDRGGADPRGPGGFTLIETLAVLLAAALITSVAAARLGPALAAARLAGAARGVSGSFLQARDAALVTGRTVIVEWAGGSGRYGFRRSPVPGAADRDEVPAEIDLPDGCRFAGGGGRILFFPDGSCDGGPVIIVREDGRSVTIELHPALGLPSVSSAIPGRAHRVMRARPG